VPLQEVRFRTTSFSRRVFGEVDLEGGRPAGCDRSESASVEASPQDHELLDAGGEGLGNLVVRVVLLGRIADQQPAEDPARNLSWRHFGWHPVHVR
jgi:hypothetical protein